MIFKNASQEAPPVLREFCGEGGRGWLKPSHAPESISQGTTRQKSAQLQSFKNCIHIAPFDTSKPHQESRPLFPCPVLDWGVQDSRSVSENVLRLSYDVFTASSLSIPLVLSFFLYFRVLKKLILIVFTSLLVASMMVQIFGTPCSTIILSDITCSFVFKRCSHYSEKKIASADRALCSYMKYLFVCLFVFSRSACSLSKCRVSINW